MGDEEKPDNVVPFPIKPKLCQCIVPSEELWANNDGFYCMNCDGKVVR